VRWRNATLIGIALLTVIVLWVSLAENINIELPGGGTFHREGWVLGLDLRGGTHLIYEADMTGVPFADQGKAIEGVKRTIERRVNAYGVSEPEIQVQGSNRISIQLPGVRNVDEAVKLIGQTAQLEFKEQQTDAAGNVQWFSAMASGKDGVLKPLTGKYLKNNAAVVLDPTTNQPQVAFEFNDEGAYLFDQITGRLIGKPLGIVLDNQMISAPTVQARIGSKGVITGLDLERARELTILLNEGALPVPLKGPIVREDIDPTLGADSVEKSKVAGLIGLGLVFIFMVVYYRLPGLLATVALAIYSLIVVAIFKLIPVTLTLAGVAAFILSIGMAVDANILIYERMKEEVRAGRTLGAAIEAGFARAWPSIRDSNVSTFITCIILWWFGDHFSETRIVGFALTLFIGVAVSMFSAITVTRTFLRLFVGTGLAQKLGLFVPMLPPQVKEGS